MSRVKLRVLEESPICQMTEYPAIAITQKTQVNSELLLLCTGLLSSAEARGVKNQVSGHRAWRIEHQRCEPLLGRTRFSVLLTITRDPCKLEDRNFDRR